MMTVSVAKHHVPRRNVVAVWRNDLLPLSETFIAEQTNSLQRYRPIYVGRSVRNRDVFNLHDVLAVRDLAPFRGRLEQGLYTITRRSPLLMSHLRKENPQLIHAHFGTQAVYALPYKRELKIPLLTTFHGQDATRSLKSIAEDKHPGWVLFRRYLRELQEHGDRFLAVSCYVRNCLIERGFPPERTEVHHIGIDVDRFQFVDSLVDSPRPRIITVCRLVDKKGTHYLIRAFALLVQQIPDVELLIIGDGPLRSSLSRLVVDLGIAPNVRFLGALPHNRVQDELARAHVFALPSVTAGDGSSEGLPISILEAMAVGIPVAATSHSGIPEAIRDEETGILVPERDVEALAVALQRLVEDSDLTRRLRQQARMRVEREFSIRLQSQKLECIYDQLLEDR